MKKGFMNLLEEGLQQLEIPPTKKQIQDFTLYLEELRKWNRAYNLTGLTSDEDIVMKHFLDSLLYLKLMPQGILDIADVGSGAGFPGIPIKIIRPEIHLTLIETSRKKTAFLRHITRVLSLKEVTIIQQRIEQLGDDFKKKFDIALSRATFSIRKFIEIACPYVKDSGSLILSKGRRISEELKELDDYSYAKKSMKQILTLELPIVKIRRNLVLLKCVVN